MLTVVLIYRAEQIEGQRGKLLKVLGRLITVTAQLVDV